MVVIFIWWAVVQGKKETQKKEQQEWAKYLVGLTERQCFSVANDKSQTKFTDAQRSEAYRRGCELRRIRELGQ